jgi:amino acid adenylation domain-containing protein
MNFAHLLFDGATVHPARMAIRDGVRELTYSQLAGRAAAIANALVEAGARPGDRIGIALPHGADSAAAIFGVLAAGGISVSINAAYRPRQVEYVLGHCGAKLVLTSDGWRSMQPRPLAADARLLRIEDVPEYGGGAPSAATGNAPAQITYTSGSTGAPKGVVTSHANLWSGVGTVVRYLGIHGDDRIVGLLPFSFVYGFSQLTCALAAGARLDIMPAALPGDLADNICQLESTVLAAVPPLWAQILRVPRFREPIPSLRVLTCAGGRLSPELVRAVRSAQPHARLFLMYGFTEVFRSSYLSPEEVDDHPDSMGRAIEGSHILVLRPDGTECSPGEVGELVHAGPGVALGYWNDPRATAETFFHVTLPADEGGGVMPAARSGDLVRRDAEGRLYYVGRRDRMIKTMGMRVSPDEVADVLYASGEVVEAAVTSEPDEERGERIVAHVVLSGTGTLQALKRFAGTELPRYLQPAVWFVRESLPRNASGKHDLQALDGSTRVVADPQPERSS